MSVIPAEQEADVGRVQFKAGPSKKCKTLPEK
jgi:hypothetical protein